MARQAFIVILPQKVRRGAAPGVAVAVDDGAAVRGFVGIGGIVQLPEGIRAELYHSAPV